MLKQHEQRQLHKLLEHGLKPKEIADRLGICEATVYKYKKHNGQIQGWKTNKSTVPKELLPYVAFLEPRVRSRTIKQTALFFQLQQQGYMGTRRVFDEYYRTQRNKVTTPRTIKRIETAPGEQAQVDWGHFGELTINGKREKISLFSYILSHSRMLYMEFTARQNQATLQACHIRAFEKLGIPKTIVYDNMKTVVNDRYKSKVGLKEVVYNTNFTRFAHYYKFEVMACAPYWPQAKGKVESSIKLARQTFSRSTPQVEDTLEAFNERLTKWTDEIANKRNHSTTRKKPCDIWLEEKPHLRFPDLPAYTVFPFQTYRTSHHGLLTRNGIIYNLGSGFASTEITVHEVHEHGLEFLEIYHNNRMIDTVQIPTRRQTQVVVEDKNPPKEAISPKPAPDKQTPVAKQQRSSFDIDVDSRDLDYYAMAFGLKEV